ncbi:MAG TPA: PilZ domain-containing protein [Candidatus Sulfotelmatobacter sp.]
MKLKRSMGERRRWQRLPLAIPVFVRSRDDKGKELLEFATALNVSAGGMLVAVRKLLSPEAELRLEIPSAPLAALASLPRASRHLRARPLHSTHVDGYHLMGLKFSRPLVSGRVALTKRKFSSVV